MIGIFGQFSIQNGLEYKSMTTFGLPFISDATGRYRMVMEADLYDGNTAESVLEKYIQYGKNVLDTLDGGFAIAIFDTINKELFLARDCFGVMPLYYAEIDGTFYFSSQIQSILQQLGDKPIVDENAIYDYLVFNRTDQTEMTFYRDIKKLLHGSYLVVRNGQIDIQRWYRLIDHVRISKEKDETHFMNLFRKAVEKRIAGDKKWGVCLSGGLDSSAITSMIAQIMGVRNVQSFSSIYGKDSEADESRYMDYYNDIVPNRHYAHPTADSLLNDIEDLIKTQGEPTPSTSSYALYCLMQEAAKHIDVVLDGQGSDEALAGYEYQPGLYYKALFTHFRWGTLIKELICDIYVHRSCKSLKYFAFFMLPTKYRTKVRIAQKSYINPLFAHQHQGSVIADKFYGSTTMQEALINHFEYKLEHLIKWGYQDCSRWGIGGRSPFLDREWVEYALSMADDMKIRNGYTKWVLRDVMKGIMPEPVRMRRDKRGFSTPEDEWFRTPQFQEYIMAILSSNSFAQRGYILPQEAIKMYEKHLRGEINAAKDIWKCICLEMWFRIFID